jgi:hypothetical protein
MKNMESTNIKNSDLNAIQQLLAFFGDNIESSNQKSFMELEIEFDKHDNSEANDLRFAALDSFAKVIDSLSHSFKIEAVCQTIDYFSKFNIKDFTVVPVVLNKLEEYKGKELSNSDIVAISAWGNSLMEFSYGFEKDEEWAEFEGYFGKQDDEYQSSQLARGIGSAVLSLLPVEYQSPGGDDFIGYYSTGVTEAYIRFLGYGLIANKYDTKEGGPISPNFSLEIVNELFESFADWLRKLK